MDFNVKSLKNSKRVLMQNLLYVFHIKFASFWEIIN